MVCVSDPLCLSRCASQHFPCFDFQYANQSAVVFEQVAAVKLRHVGAALARGVRAVMLLDLDVGFLHDPMALVCILLHRIASILADSLTH